MKNRLIILILVLITATVLGQRATASDRLEGSERPNRKAEAVARRAADARAAELRKQQAEQFLKTLSFTQVVQRQTAAKKKMQARMGVVQFVGEFLQDYAIGAKVQRAISDASPAIRSALSKHPTELYVLEVVIDSHAPSGQKRFRQVTRHGLGSTPVATMVKSVSARSAGPSAEPGFFYDAQASYVLSFTLENGAIKVSRLFMPLLRQAVQAELERLAAAAASSTTDRTQDRGNAPDHMRNRSAKEPAQKEPQKELKERTFERAPMP